MMLTACRFNEEESATAQLTNLLNTRINKGGLFEEKAYGAQYWKTISRDKWIQSQNFINQTHGALTSYKIEEVQSKGRRKGFSSSGWVGFIISTTYSKGVQGHEQVNFYKPGKDQPFEVISHNVKSPIVEQLRKKS